MQHVKQLISVIWVSEMPEIENGSVKIQQHHQGSRFSVLFDLFCLLVCAGRGSHQSCDRNVPSFVQDATGKASKIIPMPAVIKMFFTLAGSFPGDVRIILKWLEKKVSQWTEGGWGWGSVGGRASWAEVESKSGNGVLAPSSSYACRPKCLADNVCIRQSRNNGL